MDSAARRGGSLIAALLGVAGAVLAVVLVASIALGRLGTPGSLGVAGTPVPAAVAGAHASSTPACEVTRPRPVFVPPGPDIPEGRFLARPPDYYASDWYGSARLWTMLHRDGEVWGPWVRLDDGLPMKTFWWSADWVPQDELEPAVTVVGRRLDAPGTFTFGPGTNAAADFGAAMLVGIDLPAYGCWQISARYRDASLSYVVSVVDH
jgi:hypothetical protein